MGNIYNVAIIGTGDAAQEHYRAIKENKKLKLKAFYTNKIKRGKVIESIWKVKAYFSLNQMMNLEKLDIVVVANENFKHYLTIKEVMQKKAYILLEKPISHFISETENIIKLSSNHKNKISIVLQKRFNTSYNVLKKLLSTKSIGKIIMVNLKIFMPRDKKYFSKKKWLLTNKLNNQGIVMHHAIHMLDIICWIFEKKITTVSSWMSNDILKLKIEDTCSGFFKFKDGPNINFCISICADRAQNNSIEIITTKKTLIVNDHQLKDITNNKLIVSKNLKNNFQYGDYKNVWQDFINSIDLKKQSKTDCSTTITTHKLIDKIYKK